MAPEEAMYQYLGTPGIGGKLGAPDGVHERVSLRPHCHTSAALAGGRLHAPCMRSGWMRDWYKSSFTRQEMLRSWSTWPRRLASSLRASMRVLQRSAVLLKGTATPRSSRTSVVVHGCPLKERG
eukprot:551399-Amphidinium_carterae.2